MLARLKSLLSRQTPPTAEAITWAYRLILGREPSPAEVLAHLNYNYPDLQTLRRVFFGSQEFRRRERALCGPSLSGSEPALEIQDEVDNDLLEKLLAHVQQSWQQLGQTEPHYLVLSAEQFKQANLVKYRDQFYQSGRDNVDCLLKTLRRNDCFPEGVADKTVLEYGCGVGRLTYVLAQHFKQVFAYDISAPHLALAKALTDELGLTNIHYERIVHPRDVMNLPKVDVVVTLIVLQHNPPPVTKMILRSLLESLNQGGVAYFQILTYQEGYSFDAESYLRTMQSRRGQIEMHVLPQPRVFELIEQMNCQILEVLDDAWAGYHCGELSNVFLLRKK
jgi:2-polyprenyl-3-methyl-5-hydroxy-6-metoxy-1,4-benzoquinol methylase